MEIDIDTSYAEHAGEITMSVSVLVNGSPTVVADEISAGGIFYLSNILSIYTGSAWLACDGSAVSRTTYAQLFAAIGTTFGPGDGATTFNLPTRAQLNIRANVPLTIGRTFSAFAEDTDIIVNNTAAASIDISAGALIAGIRVSIIVKSTIGVTIYTDGPHTQSCLLPLGTFSLEWDGGQWALIGETAKVMIQSTSNGNWTTPFAALYRLMSIGGGGGGGGASFGTGGAASAGGGGGGATTSIISSMPAGTLVSWTIGAGGSGGAGVGNSGAAGGTTTIVVGSTSIAAWGGAGGGGAQGNSTGSVNSAGGAGGSGNPASLQMMLAGLPGGNSTGISGVGGTPVVGFGVGGASVGGNNNGNPGTGIGAGGSGARCNTNSTPPTGGHGATGGVYIEF